MNHSVGVLIRKAFASFVAMAGLVCSQAAGQTAKKSSSGVPVLEVDASWPQPLPNKWLVGAVCGTALGPQDHIWILHRPKTLGDDQKSAAPPVIEFDAQGKVVRAWGGPGAGYEWPSQEHGLFIDYKNNVWVSGVAGKDYGRILKFTIDGKFLKSIGTPLEPGDKPSNNSTTHLGRQPADMYVDPKANELYVADGDGGAQRVIVFDADTGACKRIWGAYGEKPTEGPAAKYDPNAPVSKSFLSGVHCVVIPNDGLVYVCDRNADRIQVFHKDGTFVKEAFVERSTLGNGSTFDIDFTPDQKYLYVPDGSNQKVWILQADTLEIVGAFGQMGQGPGQFRNVHSVTVDSKGNVYTGEVDGKRVQKFVPKTVQTR
jgi:DNA-binding beta-propeller fold protein YncE